MPSKEEIINKTVPLPAKPGVYLMKDAAGRVIYVGKAINLRNRVRSYFQASGSHSPKVHRLAANIADVDFIITSSELEALILESTLIKKYKPRYNVRLKDEKHYPFIKVTWQEDFPRVTTARKIVHDGARYFGPYTSSRAMRDTLDLLRRLFPYRTCSQEINGKQRRACLYYHIGRCLGPCIGATDREEYRATIERVCMFLEGKGTHIVKDLRERMERAAADLQFEKAAALRDQLNAVAQVLERQRVVSSSLSDHDVIAFARDNGSACVEVFFIRDGYLLGRDYFVLEGTSDEDDAHLVASFLQQFYSEATHVPAEVIVPQTPHTARVIEAWLRERRGSKVTIHMPRRGEKRQLLELASENAAETLASLRAQWEADEGRAVTALEELRVALNLPQTPTRIECYDISNIQGTNPVGSMAVFVKGVPRKSDYRRFRVRSVLGANDFAMMKEVIYRRLGTSERERDDSFATFPDLIIVDGGRGQLSAALSAMREAGSPRIPVIALAKENEDVYLPHRDQPVQLARGSQGLFLLQRIRDEAHRFAIQYHRTLRRKAASRSLLEDIPGIGPKRRRALMRHFRSLEAIKQASTEELARVPGMTRKAAEAVKQHL